ncbi:hypothetical protein FGADI_12773 [Fusarium gaditjirri]|uniref:Ankyrin n=1 Tax=Fusarium gaditjirri TaxID=282569 RepID=A0A8H4SR82_9HYPO|nr:hypothetical protein FGADI_12773 [Fusarium gaditjirri]
MENHDHMGAAIANVTRKCLGCFEGIEKTHDKNILEHLIDPIDKRQRSSFCFFGLHYKFQRWIHTSGALSPFDSSLDERLKGFKYVSSTVNHMLAGILQSLNRQCALEHLHFISNEIRRTSPQQLEESLAMTESDEQMAFREDMVALVGYRFPAARKALCQLLGNSIAERRHILFQAQIQARQPANRVSLKRVQSPSQEVLRRVMSNFTTPEHESSEFPPIPKVNQEQAAVQCPFCFMVWKQTNSENVNMGLWKLHIDEHIKPYSCLFPRCANSCTFFARQQEWVDHMQSVHSEDWLRQVHIKQWYCDFGHESTLTFELEVQWREHMLDSASHPERPETPTLFQLKALSQQKQRMILRDKFVCLLCERIPQEAQQKLETGQQDSTDVHNSVINHDTTHLKSLSLFSVPSLDEAADETVNLDQKSHVLTKLSNKGSLPDAPASPVNTRASGISPDERPGLKHETVALNQQTGWDDDFVGYKQPDKPPESPMLRWYDDFSQWKYEQDAGVNRVSGKAPVPDGLSTSEIQTSTTDVNFQDDVGRTALSLASQAGDVETMSRLMTMGADFEMADRDGKTPLCWAAGDGQESAVKFLLDKGARIEATEQIYGRTSLSWAATRGHAGVVWALCTNGAHIDAVDDSDRTPLSWAASSGNEDTLRLLIDAGSDVMSKDSQFLRTPLHWAAIRYRPRNASLLLQHGAQIDALDRSGRTPLCLASEDGYDGVVELLLRHGADMEAQHPEYKQTPLSLASEGGHEDVVRLLLENGAKVDATDSQGKTARDRAIDQGWDEIAKLLEIYPGSEFLCRTDKLLKMFSVNPSLW